MSAAGRGAPLLSIARPARLVSPRHRTRRRAARRGRQGRELRRPREHDRGARRRVRIWQERHRDVDVNLLPDNAERSGAITFQRPRPARALRATICRRCAASDIACVFQDPMSSLNPVFTVGAAALRAAAQAPRACAAAQALERAEALLVEVGMPEPTRRLAAYPHQLSGGQQQRVMIAMALACEPKLLIADEPTTALDVTIQRQILELLAKLKQQRRMSMLFISHDLGVVGEIADHVVVMRHGKVREQGGVAQPSSPRRRTPTRRRCSPAGRRSRSARRACASSTTTSPAAPPQRPRGQRPRTTRASSSRRPA